jgi:hypothetical protein
MGDLNYLRKSKSCPQALPLFFAAFIYGLKQAAEKLGTG